MGILSIIGVAIVGYVFVRFIKGLGNRIPILELLLLIAGLQWIIGPAIEYVKSTHHYKYFMYVDEYTYMSYAVPSYLILVLTVLYGIKTEPKINFKAEHFYKESKHGVSIFFIGLFCDLMQSKVPGGLQFFFFLLANFKYVGALILLFSNQKKHRYLFYGSIVYLFFSSLRAALFHDFILWGTFFYMFWAYKVKPSIKMSLIIIFSGFIFGTVIQLVKSDYRALVWDGYSGNKLELFVNVLDKKLSGGFAENTEEQGELNVRLNQGWIISAVMDHTPRNQPFADGGTIIEAISASVLPRFLNPNKKEAGGVENFKKYTGLSLGAATSMGISMVGEFYANFGVIGGVFFMGLWGWVLSKFWQFLLFKSKSKVIILFFLPLVFLQVVKAETELVVVLNHLVKSILVVFLFIWFSERFLKWRFEKAE